MRLDVEGSPRGLRWRIVLSVPKVLVVSAVLVASSGLDLTLDEVELHRDGVEGEHGCLMVAPCYGCLHALDVVQEVFGVDLICLHGARSTLLP